MSMLMQHYAKKLYLGLLHVKMKTYGIKDRFLKKPNTLLSFNCFSES